MEGKEMNMTREEAEVIVDGKKITMINKMTGEVEGTAMQPEMKKISKSEETVIPGDEAPNGMEKSVDQEGRYSLTIATQLPNLNRSIWQLTIGSVSPPSRDRWNGKQDQKKRRDSEGGVGNMLKKILPFVPLVLGLMSTIGEPKGGWNQYIPEDKRKKSKVKK